MDQLIQRIREWWNTADRTTRVVMVVGGLLLIAGIGLTLSLSSAPKMAPVVSGMSESDSSGVYDELNKKGFKVDITPQGEVVVPAKDVPRARMALASANKLPKGSSGNFGLDKIGPMDTPGVEQTKLLKSLESDLSSSIQSIDGVASATVQIAPGKDSAVLDEKEPPKAVVAITETTPGSVSKDSGKAIANLVQSSVTGLLPKGVTVITNSGQTLYDGSEQDSDTALANSKLETEKQQSKALTQELQHELDLAFGHGATIAEVKVNFDMDPTTLEKHDVRPTDTPLQKESGKEIFTGVGQGAPTGVAGAEANNPANPATPATTGADSHKYDGNVVSETYGQSYTDTKQVKAPVLSGEVITVLADTGKIKDIKPLQTYVSSKISSHRNDPAFATTVVPTAFSTSDTDLAKKANDDASGAQRMQQLMALLPIVALLVVGFLVAKSLKDVVPTSVTVEGEAAGHQLAGAGRGVAALGSSPSPHSGFEAYAMEGPHVENSNEFSFGGVGSYLPSFNDTRVSTAMGEVKQAAGLGLVEHDPAETVEEKEARQTAEVMRALGIESDDEVADIEAMKKRINVPLEKIKRMADRKPETVALIIKSWMMEDNK